jgi:hypothetical protein
LLLRRFSFIDYEFNAIIDRDKNKSNKYVNNNDCALAQSVYFTVR